MKKSIIFCFLTIVMAGCRTTPTPVLSVSPSTLNFDEDGGSKDFTVTSNVYWTISKLPTWIDVSLDASMGKATVTVTAEPNPENASRTSRDNEFIITATDVPALTVTVIQKAAKKVNIAAIVGVNAPVAGATPVNKIIETNEYTGAVTWTPADARFVARTEYAATITLTAEPGYTLQDVEKDFFTVAGAAATYTAGSNKVTAVFPPDGTKDYPFQVATVADLQKVGKGAGGWTLDKHYLQTANINLNTVTNWTPIGDEPSPFTGSYDGDGYSISNLTISGTTEGQGLFGWINPGGAVRNVALKNVNITSTEANTGGIAGRNWGSTIENCYVTGSVSGPILVGGVSGGNWNAVIKNCYTACEVSGSMHIGGIVGHNDKCPTVSYCYATGGIFGYDHVGGIVGFNCGAVDVIVERCVALNTEVYAHDISGLVGRITDQNDAGNLINNYARADMKLTAYSINIDLTGLTGATTIHGEDVTATNHYNIASWWSGTVGFSGKYWTFNNRLPHLKTTTEEAFKEPQWIDN